MCNTHQEKQLTSTPISSRPKSVFSPKERVAHHQETLQLLNNICSVLENVDKALISIVELVSDVKRVVDKSVTPSTSDNFKTFTQQMTEHIASIESKLKHHSTSTDSLHTKANTLDNQVKQISGNQTKIFEILENLQKDLESHKEFEDSITHIKEKIQVVETKSLRIHDHDQELNWIRQYNTTI